VNSKTLNDTLLSGVVILLKCQSIDQSITATMTASINAVSHVLFLNVIPDVVSVKMSVYHYDCVSAPQRHFNQYFLNNNNNKIAF